MGTLLIVLMPECGNAFVQDLYLEFKNKSCYISSLETCIACTPQNKSGSSYVIKIYPNNYNLEENNKVFETNFQTSWLNWIIQS